MYSKIIADEVNKEKCIVVMNTFFDNTLDSVFREAGAMHVFDQYVGLAEIENYLKGFGSNTSVLCIADYWSTGNTFVSILREDIFRNGEIQVVPSLAEASEMLAFKDKKPNVIIFYGNESKEDLVKWLRKNKD